MLLYRDRTVADEDKGLTLSYTIATTTEAIISDIVDKNAQLEGQGGRGV